MKARGTKGVEITAAEIYADVPRNTFFCKVCGAPAHEHTYCEKHWNEIGLHETEVEKNWLHTQVEADNARQEQMWRR